MTNNQMNETANPELEFNQSYWIVWRYGIQDSIKKFSSRKLAEHEASNLAKEHKGLTFTVFQSICDFTTESVVRIPHREFTI